MNWVKNLMKYRKKCRNCNKIFLQENIHELGFSPHANSLENEENRFKSKIFPLSLSYCNYCELVQSSIDFSTSDIFQSDYPYLSSQSESFLNHWENSLPRIIRESSLKQNSKILEIASNDGYLQDLFLKKNFRVLGVEPSPEPAKIAIAKKHQVYRDFFSYDLSNEILKLNGEQDLIIANNVVAHVPLINNFIKGIKNLLSKNGTAIFEFSYLMDVIKHGIFDTIYHEHVFYHSVTSMKNILLNHELEIFDLEKLDLHGGSLRLYVGFKGQKKIKNNVYKIIEIEKKYHQNLNINLKKIVDKSKEYSKNLLNFFLDNKQKNKIIFGYGAAAKTTTSLNLAKISNNHLEAVCDSANTKVGRFIPHVGIPIISLYEAQTKKCDIIIIFAWNYYDEIKKIIENSYNEKKLSCPSIISSRDKIFLNE